VFVLKKIIAPLFTPLSLCLEILLLGLFLLWFTPRQKAGKIVLTIGVGLFIVFSFRIIPDIMLRSLENKYPPILNFQDLQDVKWIVVLGGGHTSDPRLPSNGQISGSTLSRLIEGIRIQKNVKDGKLILSGGTVFDPVPEAKTMAEVARDLGVEEDDIIMESNSRDTEDQAKIIKKLLNYYEDEKLILVTSAAHMPRSMLLFKKYGMQPIPAPIDFGVKKQQGNNPKDFFPSSSKVAMIERALHEYLGLLWLRLKGEKR